LAAFDQGAISAANFFATIILARSATPAELGIYGVGFTALHLARSFQDGLVVQPVSVFGASQPPEIFRRYATSSGLIQLALACLSALVVYIVGKVVLAEGNDMAGAVLLALPFCFLFWQLQEYIRRLLYTRGHVLSAVLNTMLANAVRLSLMLVLASQGRLTGAASLDAIAWGSLAALVPGLWVTRNYWTAKPINLLVTWKRNWGFGRWILGSSLASWTAVEFYPVLTAGMVSFAAAGAYRALQNLVAPIHLLLRATDTFLTPRAARLYHRDGKRSLNRVLGLTYLFAGLPIFGLLGLALLFPAPLLRTLYGETYVPYSRGILLMALFYGLLYAYWPLQTAFKAVRNSRPIFAANLAAALVMFTAGLWAIQRWGVYGTMAGQALNALVVNIVLWGVWLRRE
jgi:O-antigen/teichoic acid export membrane protein